jgi:N-acetylmuramoyl-L-alanine amidase/putative methionine-R-sulfoxide reductase with GAF domain
MELLNLNSSDADLLNVDLLNPGHGNRMATTPSKTQPDAPSPLPETGVSAWPRGAGACGPVATSELLPTGSSPTARPSRHEALQALLAFSALHDQVRRRRSLASHLGAPGNSADSGHPAAEFEPGEQFVLDEVLQLVAERAVAITGANGLAVALAENNEIVLRASAGTIKPDVGARIDRDSAFSGACFRTAQVVRCDDTDTDARVNAQACRHLGARSMVAVPLCGRRRVIGLLEAFSSEPFGFNDSDVRNLSLLAELVLGALKPDDEDRFAESAQVASTKLEPVAPQPEEEKKPLSGNATAIAPPGVLETAPSTEAVEAAEIESAPPKEDAVSSATGAEFESQDNHEKPGPDAESDGEETAPSNRHPGLWLVVALIIIFAVVAAGIWWKIKHSQLNSGTVRAEKPAPSALSGPAEAAHPASASSSPIAGTNGKTAAEAGIADEPGDAAAATATAASPQELSKFPRVTGIRHWSSSDSSTVVLDLQDQVQYEAHRLTSPDRIYFDLHDTVLASDLSATNIEIGDALLSRVRVAQPVAGMTRVVLETKGNSNFSVSMETNPYRLVVEVRKIGANPKGAVNLFPDAADGGKDQLAIVVPPPTKEDLQLRARVPKMRIVVDAGHGGWDLGTVGRRGLLEKDVVLEIAQRLGKLLETRLGMEVLYTRQDDNYIPLDERAEIANQAQADLFVSVHANYSDLPSARGVETYYTNFFSAPSPKDLELRSHAGGDAKPVTAGLSAADLHERIEQSRRLAASVQRSLYGTLSVENPGLRDRGIKEAGFVVLTETSMPGILAEVSFVSSPSDEQKLRSDGYREQIAEALYKGIARYAANSHGVKVASAAK